MSLLYVCTVKDRALDAFGRPFFVPSVGVAERSFMDELRNPESELAKHPEDYDLYLLGTYDDATGLFNCSHPTLMLRAQDCAPRKEG